MDGELVMSSSFTISLDFELYWGVRDKRSIESYKQNLDGVYTAIPKMLEQFNRYNIHATWATVGFLFFKDFDELKKHLPDELPCYEKKELSAYDYILHDENSKDLKYHFARELICTINQTPFQEIASHTFSHFYTREQNSSKDSFKCDARAYEKLAKDESMMIDSIVFPRNQIDHDDLKALKDVGIKVYRGNPTHWAYRDGDIEKSFFKRVFRFIDIYLNLSGHHTSLPQSHDGLVEVKSSMFFRPYSKKFSFLESLKLKRVKNAMTHAAKKKQNFHLWWHPHNFGVNQEQNLKNLEEILKHYQFLRTKYSMKSLTMKELVNE